jgi:hypothetical protein
MRDMKSLASHIIRLFFVASFLTCGASVHGQVMTVIASDVNQKVEINIPAGKYMEILGYSRGTAQADGGRLYINNPSGNLIPGSSYALQVRFIAGPNVLVMTSGLRPSPVLTYRLIDNTASSTRQQASPKADDIKLTDEFLMLDYTVQANTTYKLGISKDLKSWKPLFEFTPESDKLNVELPKIILGNQSFLKLE